MYVGHDDRYSSHGWLMTASGKTSIKIKSVHPKSTHPAQ
jgi:hypothetical protein